jgi:hypothetical protein
MSGDTEAYPQLTPAKRHRWDSIERGILAAANIALCCIAGTLAGLTHTHLMRALLTLVMLWAITEFVRILVSPR